MRIKEKTIFVCCWVIFGLNIVSCYAQRNETVRPLNTGRYQLAAFFCPLWKRDTIPSHWEKLKDYPDRKPVLGWYNEGDPKVTDKEIQFAVEHGISMFNICWYRQKENEGKSPVVEIFGHWTKNLPLAKNSSLIKYSILYVDETGSVMGGIRDMLDFTDNLVPYWIKTHFLKPNYHKVDNKPVFTIYRPENFIEDLGGIEQARKAISYFREACVKAGFSGLILLGEYHNDPSADVSAMYAGLGLDYAVSYHWPSFMDAMRERPLSQDSIVMLQQQAWLALTKATGLPSLPTVSVGWDSSPWGNMFYKGKWRLDSLHYLKLLQAARVHADTNRLQHGELEKLIYLDNWNEYAEGHHIFPTASEGFLYLELVRSVFKKPQQKNRKL